MKAKLNQSGIAHIGLILVSLLVIGVVGFAAYRINNSKTEEPEAQQAVKTETPKKEEIKKKTYEFELTDLKMDIPESWQVDIESRSDGTQDGKNDSYTGKIKAANGWGVSFSAGFGGIGGGPSCNAQGNFPELAPCPKYTVLSRDVLGTGDILISYSSTTANTINAMNNCTVIKDSQNQYNQSQNQVGESVEGDVYTCFSNFSVNKSIENAEGQNMPTLMTMSIVYPYDLDKKASTDFTKDVDYQAVLEALKTLRKS